MGLGRPRQHPRDKSTALTHSHRPRPVARETRHIRNSRKETFNPVNRLSTSAFQAHRRRNMCMRPYFSMKRMAQGRTCPLWRKDRGSCNWPGPGFLDIQLAGSVSRISTATEMVRKCGACFSQIESSPILGKSGRFETWKKFCPLKKILLPTSCFCQLTPRIHSQAGFRVPWDSVVEARRVWVDFA